MVAQKLQSAKMKRAEQGRQSLPALSTTPAVKEQGIMAERDSICVPDEKPVEYRDIPGFPHYRVGNDGTIWTCWNGHVHTQTWRKLSPSSDRSGYLRIHICNRTIKRRMVHHLVLEAFVGPRPLGMEACHNNGNPGDNRLENLRWDTKKGNCADRDRHNTALRGEANHQCKLTDDKVREIRQRLSSEKGSSLAREFGVSESTISLIKLNKKW